MTKKIKEIYERYLDSDTYDLFDAYGRPSERKREAWKECKALCEKMGGTDLRIIGHNSSFFSAGFTHMDNGTEKFVYITHCGTRSEAIDK